MWLWLSATVVVGAVRGISGLTTIINGFLYGFDVYFYCFNIGKEKELYLFQSVPSVTLHNIVLKFFEKEKEGVEVDEKCNNISTKHQRRHCTEIGFEYCLPYRQQNIIMKVYLIRFLRKRELKCIWWWSCCCFSFFG